MTPTRTGDAARSTEANDSERLIKRLAAVSAHSAELLAELECRSEALGRANAHAAELMAENESKNLRIERLNQSLASANAASSELVAELQMRTEELQEALARIKTLEGIVPICMHCHKIRNDEKSTWQKLERYIKDHTNAHLSHALCPQCLEEKYPDEQKTA